MTDPRADALRAGYAPVASGYRAALSDELASKPYDRAFLDAFAELCTGPLIEVGAGPAQIAAYLATRGAQIEATDLSPEMIAEARAAHPTLAVRVADMFALPYADGSLAGVVAFYAIVHTPTAELAAPFAEWHRVLAPGGRVAIAFHVEELVPTTDDGCLRVRELFGAQTALDFYLHDTARVVAALRSTGFAIEAQLVREPHATEHATRRAYLVARRS